MLYKGENGSVAHEFILDMPPAQEESGDQRGGHRQAPDGLRLPRADHVLPGANTLMIEPTESESRYEIDRFCDAMIAIREEISAVQRGDWPAENNPLVNAPHTMADLMDAQWERPYSRETRRLPLGGDSRPPSTGRRSIASTTSSATGS